MSAADVWAGPRFFGFGLLAWNAVVVHDLDAVSAAERFVSLNVITHGLCIGKLPLKLDVFLSGGKIRCLWVKLSVMAFLPVALIAVALIWGWFLNSFFRESRWTDRSKVVAGIITCGALLTASAFYLGSTVESDTSEEALCDQAGMDGTRGLEARCVDAVECLNEHGVEFVASECSPEELVVLQIFFEGLDS